MEDELKGKISAMKSLSIDIGVEVQEQNKLLRNMDDSFDSSHSLITNTISKVMRLSKSGSRYYIFLLLLFCLFVFIVLWFFIR